MRRPGHKETITSIISFFLVMAWHLKPTNKQIKLIMETNTKTKNEIMSREGTRTNNG